MRTGGRETTPRTPVVFLHGSRRHRARMVGATSTRIGGRVAIAIDTIGDVGRSEQKVAVEDAADYAQWLEETLAGLDIERARIWSACRTAGSSR